MGKPAAKQGDAITARDLHDIQPPSGGRVKTMHQFSGAIDGRLSSNVMIMGKPAATKGSTATNNPAHKPIGGTFVKPPADLNKATILSGSPTVNINGKPAARNGDPAETCNDPVDLPVGTVIAGGTVFVG